MKKLIFAAMCTLLLGLSTLGAAVKATHPRIWLTDELLSGLRSRAASNTPEWTALKNWCDSNLGTLATTDFNGWGWSEGVQNYTLAYQILKDSNPSLANQYADKALVYLDALINDLTTVGDGKGGLTPVTMDSGFPIRVRGVATALAYDWLYDYPGFTAAKKTETYEQLNQWLVWYSTGGYSRDAPISNYFSGYFLAKCLAGYATYGDNPQAPALIDHFRNTMFEMVKSAFTTNLSGGDWPEGWNYGAGVAERIGTAVWAVKTATGEDLIPAFPWLRDVIYLRTHSLFPNRDYTYDGGSWTGSYRGNPLQYDMLSLAAIFKGTTDGAYAQYYTTHLNWTLLPPSLFQKFLYQDTARTSQSPNNLPMAYRAAGTGFVTMRQSWDVSPSVTWASFQSGPYLSAQGAQNRDQGHFIIYKHALLAVDAAIVTTSWLSPASTKLHNTFLIDDAGEGMLTYPPEQGLWGNTTHIDQFENAEKYVLTVGNIANAYISNIGKNPVTKLLRYFVYMRPDYFVVYDEVKTSKDYYRKTWQMHVKNEPSIAGDLTTTAVNGQGKLFLKPLMPDNCTLTKASDSDLSASSWRISIQAPVSQATETYMNVLYATDISVANMPATEKIVSASGNMNGALIHASGSQPNWAVMFGSTDTVNINSGSFQVSGTGALNALLCKVQPSTVFDIKKDGGRIASKTSSASNTLYFESTLEGTHTFTLAVSTITLYNVSGVIRDSKGMGIPNIRISASGSISATAMTDANGFFKFYDLEDGADLQLAPANSNYVFTPQQLTVSVQRTNSVNNFFTALPSASSLLEGDGNMGEIRVVGSADRRGAVNPDLGDTAKIYFKGKKTGRYDCRIFTLTGRLVWQDSRDNVAEGMFEWIPVDIAAGGYVVSVKGPDFSYRRKIVIVH